MNKSRDLTLFDFFSKLQEEYIVAELRRKIYPKIKDKKFWEKVMVGKKEKIEDISLRNSLPNIFNNEKVKEKKYSIIYKKTGFPNFLYKDTEDSLVTQPIDKKYYYNIGSQVRVNEGEDIFIGTIQDVDFSVNKAVVIIADGDYGEFDLGLITRIL